MPYEFKRHEWVPGRPVSNTLRKRILDVGGLGEPAADDKKQVEETTDPLELRREILLIQAPGCEADVERVRSTLAERGAGAYCDEYPALPYALVHDAYHEAKSLDPGAEEVAKHARFLFDEHVADVLYEEKIRRACINRGLPVKDGDLAEVRQRMQRDGVAYGAKDFEEAIWPSQQAATINQYNNASAEIDRDRRQPIGAAASADLAGRLDELGFASDKVDRPLAVSTWVAMASSPGGGALADDVEIAVPDLDESVSPEAARAFADLYWVSVLADFGAFDAIHELADRYLKGANIPDPLGRRLYRWITHQTFRMGEQERTQLLGRLVGDASSEFHSQLRAMAEQATVYANSRSANELLSGAVDPVSVRAGEFALDESVLDVQLWMTSHACGIVPQFAREVTMELTEALQILGSDELSCALGCECGAETLSNIEALVQNETRRPAAQVRALLRLGRPLLLKLAQDAARTGDRTSADREAIASLAIPWLAAERMQTDQHPRPRELPRGTDRDRSGSADNGAVGASFALRRA